ncbi:subtilisin-like protease, partial [Trifolium medium]|nr:subtilisin-like protease [Trifolium medium]
EEVVTEERNDRGNHHDYRVKADIPLFYGTMGVEGFLDWQIETRCSEEEAEKESHSNLAEDETIDA